MEGGGHFFLPMPAINQRILALYQSKVEASEDKYTKSHFAKDLGISRQALNHLINTDSPPSYDTLQRIYKKFPELQLDWYFNE